jgi:hypothetical protein
VASLHAGHKVRRHGAEAIGHVERNAVIHQTRLYSLGRAGDQKNAAPCQVAERSHDGSARQTPPQRVAPRGVDDNFPARTGRCGTQAGRHGRGWRQSTAEPGHNYQVPQGRHSRPPQVTSRLTRRSPNRTVSRFQHAGHLPTNGALLRGRQGFVLGRALAAVAAARRDTGQGRPVDTCCRQSPYEARSYQELVIRGRRFR